MKKSTVGIISLIAGALILGAVCVTVPAVNNWFSEQGDKISQQFDKSDSTQPETKKYVVSDLPSWIKSDDSVVFAWAGSDDSNYSWYQTTFSSDTSVSFFAPSNISICVLVRCVKDTTTPSWDIKEGSEIGRIFNQTTNLTISDSMSAPESLWQAYPNS